MLLNQGLLPDPLFGGKINATENACNTTFGLSGRIQIRLSFGGSCTLLEPDSAPGQTQ